MCSAKHHTCIIRQTPFVYASPNLARYHNVWSANYQTRAFSPDTLWLRFSSSSSSFFFPAHPIVDVFSCHQILRVFCFVFELPFFCVFFVVVVVVVVLGGFFWLFLFFVVVVVLVTRYLVLFCHQILRVFRHVPNDKHRKDGSPSHPDRSFGQTGHRPLRRCPALMAN